MFQITDRSVVKRFLTTTILLLLGMPISVEALGSKQQNIREEILAKQIISSSIVARDFIKERSITEANRILYINSQRGNDINNGTEKLPLKTITKALEVAEDGNIIYLSTGVYSEETGETFPLIIKNKIKLQGVPIYSGTRIIIKGGGSFMSNTSTQQNVTVVATKDVSEIKGITITNPDSRGYGLWIDSASPKIEENTFIRNGSTGIFISGNSKPIINNNDFEENEGNGILISGNTNSVIENNTFHKTGFGVSLIEGGLTILRNNSFQRNRTGIIIQGDSQAILRNNKITQSWESGFVAVANSRADLGTYKEPGENTFNNNLSFDIKNLTNNPITVVGTMIKGRTQGHISNRITSNSPIVTNNSSQQANSRLREIPLPPKQTTNENNIVEKNNLDPTTLNYSQTLPPPKIVTNPNTERKINEYIFTPDNSDFNFPTNTLENNRSLPNNSSTKLNSPNQGNINSLSDILGSSISSNIQSNFTYRVLVEIINDLDKRKIKSIYPNASPTIYQGKQMLEIGYYNDRKEAEKISFNLTNLGLSTHILDEVDR